MNYRMEVFEIITHIYEIEADDKDTAFENIYTKVEKTLGQESSIDYGEIKEV